MKKVTLLILALAVSILSCNRDDDDDPIDPPVNEDFLIDGTINNSSLNYAQTVFDGGTGGGTNVFYRSDRFMYLEAYKNGQDQTDGFWVIRINNVDIENLTLPHSLTGAEGSITWVDESVKPLKNVCASPDVLCFYAGVGVDEVDITITEIANNVISGEFSGILNHIQVNPTVDRDTDDFVEVTEGSFQIQYMVRD